jgi:hypothetical protein
MMLRFRSLIVPLCLFGCLFVVFGCKKKLVSEDAGTIPDNLAIAALQTHARYIKAVNSGQQEPSNEISKEYWTDEIKRLKPIKVYMHRINIVVVQRASAEIQEGKYICIMISSYAPRSGDDGFTFTEIGNSVYDFKRVMKN